MPMDTLTAIVAALAFAAYGFMVWKSGGGGWR